MPRERLRATGLARVRAFGPAQYGRGTEHLEKRLASWRGGVDGLPVEIEVDTGALQLTEKPDQVL